MKKIKVLFNKKMVVEDLEKLIRENEFEKVINCLDKFKQEFPKDINYHFPKNDDVITWNLLGVCISAHNLLMFEYILEGKEPIFYPMTRDCVQKSILNSIIQYGNKKFLDTYIKYYKDDWKLWAQEFLDTNPYITIKPDISQYFIELKINHIFFNRVGFWKPVDKFYQDIFFDIPNPQKFKVSQNIIEFIKKNQDNASHIRSFFGFSCCRLCDKHNGSKEYYLVKNNIGYVWPEGYLHYIIEHNVHPSINFVDFLKS